MYRDWLLYLMMSGIKPGIIFFSYNPVGGFNLLNSMTSHPQSKQGMGIKTPAGLLQIKEISYFAEYYLADTFKYL